MRVTLGVLAILAATAPAHANDTFEAKAQGAPHVRRLDDLVWALTAACDRGDDTQQRQCRRVRDRRAAELAATPLLVDADPEAFAVGAWNAARKSAPITLSPCIRCAGVEVGGTLHVVVANVKGALPRIVAGKPEGRLHDGAQQFANEDMAKTYAQALTRARVQLLVKVAAKPRAIVDGKHVLALDVIGYRVYMPCDGSIVVANPPSGPAEGDKQQCIESKPQ